MPANLAATTGLFLGYEPPLQNCSISKLNCLSPTGTKRLTEQVFQLQRLSTQGQQRKSIDAVLVLPRETSTSKSAHSGNGPLMSKIKVVDTGYQQGEEMKYTVLQGTFRR
jgi:hypothetical protein